MSTRCQIGFYQGGGDSLENPVALLYRHCDGYPDGEYGVVRALRAALQASLRRGSHYDPEFVAADVLVNLMLGHTDVTLRMASPAPFVPDRAPGYGICQTHGEKFHGDLEYYYAVYPDTEHPAAVVLKVYEVGFDVPASAYKLLTSSRVGGDKS